MKPIVDRLQVDYDGRVAFRWLDAASEGRAVFNAFALRVHPALVIIDTAGEVFWKNLGEQDRSPLKAALRQAMGEEGEIF
jgi:hypothetical protein